MSKELIERLREKADSLTTTVGVMNLLHEAADALEAKAAPVGEREAFQKPSVLKDCNVRYSISTTPQPQSAEAVAWAAQNVSSGKYGYIWHEESDVRGWINLQHQSDNSTWRGPIALYTTPQPSAGVVMPQYQPQCEDTALDEWERGWNACLREFARLNGKEVV